MPSAQCLCSGTAVRDMLSGLAFLFVCFALYAAGNKAWWTAQGALFNSVVVHAGSQYRALHLQLLNSLSNVGKFCLGPSPLRSSMQRASRRPPRCWWLPHSRVVLMRGADHPALKL